MAIRWSRLSPQLALMPAITITAVAFIGTIGWTILISFTKSRRFPDYAIDPERWARHYNRLFSDGAWATSLQNVFILAIGSALAILFGFVLAAMIEREKHGEGVFRTIFLYPLAVSFIVIVTGIVWRWMFNPALGIENYLHQLGWESANFNWLADKRTAMGGNTFQAGYLFHALMAGVGGPYNFYKFYRGTPDASVFDEQGLRDAIETFRRITDQADEGWVNRQWNESTNTVISGQTLMHLHGDWMKGQWKANNKVLGEDYNCINLPGTKALSVTVDAMGILGGDSVDEETLAAEFELASIIVDPNNNAEFASFKGSTPVRLDAPTEKLDTCNKLVLDSLGKDNFSVQNPFYIGDSDWISSVWTTMFTFQSDPDMTTDDVIEKLRDEYDAVFG